MELNEVKQFFVTLKKGQSVYIETEKQKLSGLLHHRDINGNFIYLDIVKDLKTNVEYTSRQMIPAEMVKSIELLDAADTTSTGTFASSPSSADDQAPYHTATSTLLPNDYTCPIADLSAYEIKSIQNRIDNPIIIEQSGAEYTKAIADLRAQQCISLFIEPSKYGRNFKTSIIAVATVQTVYIFDVISLGKLFSDFKNLLQADIPRKAVHGSHLAADHLKYQHSIDLNGIFDTFAAYCIVTKQKRHIDFIDIVEQFFNIDKQFFNVVIDDFYYPNNTFKRPMKSEFIRESAKRACLILKLQEHLQNKMLTKFYSQCKDFSRTFLEENYATATDIMQTKPTAGFNAITGLDARDQTI